VTRTEVLKFSNEMKWWHPYSRGAYLAEATFTAYVFLFLNDCIFVFLIRFRSLLINFIISRWINWPSAFKGQFEKVKQTKSQVYWKHEIINPWRNLIVCLCCFLLLKSSCLNGWKYKLMWTIAYFTVWLEK